MPPYVSPRCKDAPKFTVPKGAKTPLIMPLIPRGVKVVKDILSNVETLSYVDHDTKPQIDLEHIKYMDITGYTRSTSTVCCKGMKYETGVICHIIVVVYATFWEK